MGLKRRLSAISQEMLTDKLKLLNYETEFCRKKWVACLFGHEEGLLQTRPPAQLPSACP